MQCYIDQIARFEGREVEIKGWLYNKTHKGKLYFLMIRDGTGIVQAVMFKNDVSEQVFAMADKLTQESSLICRGVVRADSRAPGGYEICIRDLEVVHLAEEYPIQPKEHGVGYLMEHRHLWLRSSKQHTIIKVRAELVRTIREYFDQRGFVLLDAPVFTPSACEGTTTLFETDYFGQKAYLTQSGQLYMEAGAMAFGKVYCFGPTFRAEKSKTRRHLTEFWMVEPEVAFMDLDGDMDLAEDFICYVVERVVKKYGEEMEKIGRDIEKLRNVTKPFPRISYEEALQILKSKGIEINWGDDLGGDEETVLSEQFDRPVIIHRYPMQCKAFYMKKDPKDPRKALCMDILAPEGYGEIVGGGQREDDYQELLRMIKTHNLPEEDFQWYLDLRRYGSVPHSGFGLGIERTVGWLCGLHHVRETIPFPRTIERLRP